MNQTTHTLNTANNRSAFPVCEKFVSLNGEGKKAGQPAVFVRFRGCNLSCSYCDTKWVNEPDADAELMTAAGICEYVKNTGVTNVTLTGGEPLRQPGISRLIALLKETGAAVEVETNGAVPLDGFCGAEVRPDCFTMDYKLPSSGMEGKMVLSNFELLKSCDCVKFVAGSGGDLSRALEIIKKYRLTDLCHVYLSPVFGKIEPREIAEFMIARKMNGVNLQIQLHKVIWEPDRRGV